MGQKWPRATRIRNANFLDQSFRVPGQKLGLGNEKKYRAMTSLSRVQGLGFTVPCLPCLGFRVQGLPCHDRLGPGSRVQGLGSRVEG